MSLSFTELQLHDQNSYLNFVKFSGYYMSRRNNYSYKTDSHMHLNVYIPGVFGSTNTELRSFSGVYREVRKKGGVSRRGTTLDC